TKSPPTNTSPPNPPPSPNLADSCSTRSSLQEPISASLARQRVLPPITVTSRPHANGPRPLRRRVDDPREPPPLGQRRRTFRERRQQPRRAEDSTQPRPIRGGQQLLRPRNRAHFGQRRRRHRPSVATFD